MESDKGHTTEMRFSMQEERDYEEETPYVGAEDIPVKNVKQEHKKEGISRREIELYVALFCLGIAYLLLIDVVLS
jgi:hypothetical protein